MFAPWYCIIPTIEITFKSPASQRDFFLQLKFEYKYFRHSPPDWIKIF